MKMNAACLYYRSSIDITGKKFKKHEEIAALCWPLHVLQRPEVEGSDEDKSLGEQVAQQALCGLILRIGIKVDD